MKNEKLGVFGKGNFQKIDNNFMVEGHSVLQEVELVQEKFAKPDTRCNLPLLCAKGPVSDPKVRVHDVNPGSILVRAVLHFALSIFKFRSS